MTKLLSLALIALATPVVASAATATFDEIALPASGYNNNTGGFVGGGATFNNRFQDFGTYTTWNGFTPSKVNNPTAAGFGNQYAAITGADVSGTGNYAIAYPTATIAVPVGQSAASVRLTNTTYAALSMRDGDGFAKKFGGETGDDLDFFSVTFTGRDAAGATTGAATFFLADYRSADRASDYIVNEWATLDLAPLRDARTIGLSFASSDVGSFGINTPTYVAIDDFVLVPEPTSLAAIAGVAALALRRRHRGSRRR